MIALKDRVRSPRPQKTHHRGPVCNCSGLHINANTRSDPTRTTMLRNAFVRESDKRFRIVKKLINTSLIDNDALGLKPSSATSSHILGLQVEPISPQAYAFRTDAEKTAAFMEWLHEVDNQEILQILPGEARTVVGAVPWANVYVDSAFKKGIKRADDELLKQGIAPSNLPPNFRPSIDARFNQPIHADKIAAIHNRVYSDLKGITDAMESQISRVLAQSLAEGKGARETARSIVDRLEKTKDAVAFGESTRMRAMGRARILARTEIIRAHHVGMINTYREAGIEGVEVVAEWSTAKDDRVCPDCASMQGRIFKLDEIEPLIPLHPQCRCVALPVFPDEVDEEAKPTDKEIATITGSPYERADGTVKRQGFFEKKTGKPLPGAPKPGKKIKVPESDEQSKIRDELEAR